MEGRWDVWSTWYLMPEDKPRKVECKFCGNVILDCKNGMLFNLGYQYDGNGQIRIIVCSTHPQVKALFCSIWWTCPSTINRHGSINPYPKWVNKGCGHGNSKPFNGRRICFDISSGRGLKFHPPYKQHKGP